ncbi:glycosyltransferase family 31 protein [Lophiostoma macrostomum CBS 122681]|uniref:Glycosyltransferase family 31 protein n=1 Tax=Lophiostoma macrostomum CBS 122681 TaxID=1314788 RepID=A0A6A6TNU2_9PLEO|nr:glycosyltransferase family 31 protein [Lophiostoma macrostomum CBS 122681]
MPLSRSGRYRVPLRIVSFLVVVYGLIWVSSFPRSYDDDELPPDAQRKKASQALDPNQVDTDQLVVTIMTTATEAYAKLPLVLLLTNPVFHETMNVVSDLQMDVGAFHVHDVLDRIDINFLASNAELARYKRQVHLAMNSVDLSTLREDDDVKEREARIQMDKYKQLRMVERAWELLPERNWYIFAETDTYLVRPNVLLWLGQFDPEQPFFFANPPELDASEPSKVGSTTFVLSKQAMAKLLTERENVVAEWDTRISAFKTGFDVLAAAMSTEVNIGLNRTWPGMTGFHPGNVPYGESFWCHHVLAMHGVPEELASDTWRLQRDREEYNHMRVPLTFADLWNRFLQPENLYLPRDDWDNMSSGPDNSPWNILFEGVQRSSHAADQMIRLRDDGPKAANGEESWEACREACNGSPFCYQFSYSSVPISNHNENGKTKCHLSRSMRLGRHIEPQELEIDGEKVMVTWKSGWRRENFEKWSQQQRCKGMQDKQ